MQILMVALALSSRPMVAFTARYYYRDSRTSHSQVYVCDLAGKHRRQLTHERQDCDRVRWVGEHELAFTEGARELKLVDLRTDRVRRLFRSQESEGYLTSRPFRITRGAGSPIFSGQEGSYEVTKGGVLKHAIGADLPRPPIKTELGVVTEPTWGRAILRQGQRDKVLTQGDGLIEGFITAWVYEHQLFFLSFASMSTFGEWYFVSRLKNGKPEQIAEGHEVDFDVSRRWLGWVDHRELPRADGVPNYWIAGAGIKNWRTGKEVTLVKGLAWATSISLRPNTP